MLFDKARSEKGIGVSPLFDSYVHWCVYHSIGYICFWAFDFSFLIFFSLAGHVCGCFEFCSNTLTRFDIAIWQNPRTRRFKLLLLYPRTSENPTNPCGKREKVIQIYRERKREERERERESIQNINVVGDGFWGVWKTQGGIMIPARNMPSMIARKNKNNLGGFGSSSSTFTLSQVGVLTFHLLFQRIWLAFFILHHFNSPNSVLIKILKQIWLLSYFHFLTLHHSNKINKPLFCTTNQAKYPSRY